MAKKFVRGITDVKTINNQDFDTNNVNDLLSDGQYNYIHRKKGKNEEYHNLTDNIKTISSDNTDLLTVTNNNKTTNTATLHPKHDAQKEQVLESTRDTITINHGANGTDEKTTVDTNPQKVLEHENLISDSEYITLNHQTGENVTHIKTAKLKEKLDDLQQKVLEHENLVSDSEYITLEHQTGENTTHIKTAKLKEKLDDLQQNKQDVLVAGDGITIQGNTISARPGIAYYTGEGYRAFNQYFTHVGHTISTYTFDCEPQFTECELRSTIELDLKKFVRAGMTVSNGAVTISNDGTHMKLIKSGGSQNVNQQGTFTFYDSPNPV